MVHHATNIMARWRPLCNRHYIVSGESGESPGEAPGKRGRGSRARERCAPGRSFPKPRRSRPPELSLHRAKPAPRWAGVVGGSCPALGPGARAGVRCRNPRMRVGCWFWVVLQESRAFRAMVTGLLGGFPSAVAQSFSKTPGHERPGSPFGRFRPPKPPELALSDGGRRSRRAGLAPRCSCAAIPSAARPPPCA